MKKKQPEFKLQKTRAWSFSQLSLYESCPAKYKFRYLEGIKTPQHPAASRGSAIHAGIENFLHGKVKELPAEALAFTSIISAVKAAKPLLEHKLGVTENWASSSWADAWGVAVLDGVVITDEVVDIAEWKSGKIYDEHADQRKLYIAFAEAKWPGRHKYIATTHYIDQGKQEVVEAESGHIPEIQQEFTRRVGFMRSDDLYAPRPGWYCRYCHYSRYKGGKCKIG